MILHTRLFTACSVAAAVLALHAPALAAPVTESTAERPLGEMPKQAPQKAATYGMCGAPQNANDFPSNPVPVVAAPCDNYQTFSATSNTPSYGSSCGGFTVAFGPKGDLKPYLDRVFLKAEYGDVALTAANCASARIAAVGWGARCTDDACTSAQWEKIGGPKQSGAGVWNTVSQACYVSMSFISSKKKYKTLNLDIIATLIENGKAVRKRAKGMIYVSHPNGKCFSTTVKPK